MLGGNRQSEPKTLEALAQDGLTLFSDGIPIGLLRGLRYGIDAIAGDGVRLGLYNSERAAALAIIAHLSARGAP